MLNYCLTCQVVLVRVSFFFFFKQKTAYEMCGRDWSSDVCSSVFSWVDVRQMLLETIDLIAPPESFTITLPAQMPCLETNRTALNQVFSNLISNAVKHHDREDGQINITATEQAQLIEFTVKDDGPGIAPRYQQKVFTIFQTLKARDELESTGIGLAIVKKTVESVGGSITLESAPGNGSTFRFTWPRSA